jgi:hypothetical protein
MEDLYVFDQKGKKSFLPIMVGLTHEVFDIFAVPEKDAVGTNGIGNGITILKFKDDEIEYHEVAKDFEDEVNGDFEFAYTQVYSPDEIAYTQNSWVEFVNIRTGHAVSHVIEPKVGIYLGGLFPLDPESNCFLFEVTSPNFEVWKQTLRLVKFTKDTFTTIGEIDGGNRSNAYRQPWIVSGKQIFTYDSITNTLKCHDKNLNSSAHPFLEIFNHNKGSFRKLKEMQIHSILPFGLVVETGKDLDWKKIDAMPTKVALKLLETLQPIKSQHALYLLRWDTQDPKKQYTPLFTDSSSLIPGLNPRQYSDFQFSPDGKWLVFRDETQYAKLVDDEKTAQQRPCFIAVPIDPQNPLFFGEPIYLGKTLRAGAEPQSSAWISDPLSFVVSDGLVLYKWELGSIKTAQILKGAPPEFPTR